ncbi:MAG: histidinol phosphate phosphatase domain-containing protein [Desulfobulbaceae bacterium]|nr:histidinol phosphate phosphatase domain-containing protein [Desulfobulbaceae bacterium]
MIDLHTHTFFSDGALVPAEHLRRFEVLGYQAVAITDHADSSNIDFIVPRIVRAAQDLNPLSKTRLIPGIELTHIPPALMKPLTMRARELGALIIVGHGETPVEPVAPGTNKAAIEAGVDLLAHPGFITLEEAEAAAKNGVLLELSGRKGHCLTNGHVARMAIEVGAMLAVSSDGHDPGDFMTAQRVETVALGAGLTVEQYDKLRSGLADLLSRL